LTFIVALTTLLHYTAISPHFENLSLCWRGYNTIHHVLSYAAIKYQPMVSQYSFRIRNVWNSLPFSVVTASSVNYFTNRLHKHWESQELRYDWEAELSGTASRSRANNDGHRSTSLSPITSATLLLCCQVRVGSVACNV